MGAAGMYFSREAGKNGFGLFADLSKVLEPIMLQDLSLAKSDSNFMMKSVENSEIRLNYTSITPGRSIKQKIDDGLYQLHRQKRRLQLR